MDIKSEDLLMSRHHNLISSDLLIRLKRFLWYLMIDDIHSFLSISFLLIHNLRSFVLANYMLPLYFFGIPE